MAPPEIEKFTNRSNKVPSKTIIIWFAILGPLPTCLIFLLFGISFRPKGLFAVPFFWLATYLCGQIPAVVAACVFALVRNQVGWRIKSIPVWLDMVLGASVGFLVASLVSILVFESRNHLIYAILLEDRLRSDVVTMGIPGLLGGLLSGFWVSRKGRAK